MWRWGGAAAAFRLDPLYRGETTVVVRDGEATRSTTIHLPVPLHQQLRMAATEREVHMSTIVADAVREWLKKRSGK